MFNISKPIPSLWNHYITLVISHTMSATNFFTQYKLVFLHIVSWRCHQFERHSFSYLLFTLSFILLTSHIFFGTPKVPICTPAFIFILPADHCHNYKNTWKCSQPPWIHHSPQPPPGSQPLPFPHKIFLFITFTTHCLHSHTLPDFVTKSSRLSVESVISSVLSETEFDSETHFFGSGHSA